MIEQASLLRRDHVSDLDELRSEQSRAGFDELRRENARLRRLLDERADERFSLQALIDSLPDNLWVKDVESRFVISNKITATRIGVAGPADLIGKTDHELLPPELAEKFFADEQLIVQTGQPLMDMEEYAWGTQKWISTTKVPLRDDRNEIIGVMGISRDITERRQADALRDGQAKILEMIATSAPLDAVLDHLTRLVESQLVGIFGSVLLLDKDGARLRHGAAPSLPDSYTRAIDGLQVGAKAGSCGAAVYRREAVVVADVMSDPLWTDYWELAVAHRLRSCWSTPILSHHGAVLGTFAMYSTTVREPTESETRLVDAATRIAGIAIERKQAEDRIHFMANHDALTGLPNRALLSDRLAQAVVYAQRYDRWVTVVFVDLDNFKFVNDSLGHNAGDELLKIIARRMVDCVRGTDTVVRLGGDEFVILLFGQPKNADMASTTLQKIRSAIAEPIQIDGHALQVTCSIGLANYPNDGADAGDAAGQRRRGDVSRQGNRSRQFPVLYARAEHQGSRKIHAADRTAKRDPALGVRSALSAAGRPADRARVCGRGADPLAASDARHDPADQVHPDRRRNRPDRADRRLGAARGLPPEQGLAGRGPAAGHRLRQRLGAAIQGKEPDRPGSSAPCRTAVWRLNISSWS